MKDIHFTRNPDSLRVFCGKIIVKRYQTTRLELVTCIDCKKKHKSPEEVFAELEKRNLA